MAGLLGDIFSAGNVAKRKLTDLLGNPILSAQQILGNLNDRARVLNEMTTAAAREGVSYGPSSQQLAGLLSEAYNPVGLTVFHGSPAKFQKFDPTKIGSGEGAQAYGYGHYVAESPKVADEYRMMLSPHKVTGEAAQDLANYSLRMKPTTEEAINYLQKEKKTAINQSKASSNEFVTSEYIKQYDDAIDLLKSNKGEKSGFLYAIDLPDEQIAKMLDWDKPLSEQPKFVQDALIKSGLVDFEKNIGLSPSGELRDLGWSKNVGSLRGEELYRRLIEKQFSPERGATTEARKMSEAEASQILRQAGIPGIRYLDQGSRGTGQGTSNFVVFTGNEDLLRILERNNTPLGLLD